MTSAVSPPGKSKAFLSFFFGGVLPIVAFTVIEDQYGPLWGTVAGMIFGIGEIVYEKIRFGSVNRITWIGNLMILGLGGISIVSQDGVWFKMQPALFEAFFALLLWGSLITKKSFLVMMAEKQGKPIPDVIKPLMNALTLRLGFFFAVHAAVATWAALYWTTAQWALLKGAGLAITFVLYLGFEVLWLRFQIKRKNGPPQI
jgi:intracellular septation protein